MTEEFKNYIYLKTDYDVNTLNKLWEFYKEILDYTNYTEESDEMLYYEPYNVLEARYNKKINYDVIDTLIFVYSLVPTGDDDLIISLAKTIQDVTKYLNNLLYLYFEDKMINMTKETIYDKLQIELNDLNINNNLKIECENYLETKIDKKIEKTYQEDFIYDFFEEDFENIDEEVLEALKLSKIVEEAYDIYEYLINLDFLKDIPKHYIKNVVSFCYHQEEFVFYDYNEKINNCLAVINFKYIKNIKDVNEIIYNFFNNKKIDKKFKDKYFIFGIFNFVDDIEICEVDKNNDFYKGQCYFQSNNFDENNIQTLIDSIDNYWNDMKITNHNKDFQLGIIYEGVKSIQENLEYWIDDDCEDDLVLRKIL